MNEQIQTIIDRARLAVKAGPDPSSEFYGVMSVYIQPGVLTILCDALESAERRAEEAEARAAAALKCIESSAHKLWSLPPVDRTMATDAVWRDLAYFKPSAAGRALLDRLHAAEARVADLESVRIEQAAKLRRHLDELQAATAYIKDLEAEGPAACEEALRQAIEAEIEFITSDPIRDSLQRALDSVSVSEASLRLLEERVAKDKRIAELEAEVASLRARIGPEHFECPDCGPHAKADEDGCCAACGADCEVCRCDCNVRPSSAQA